MKEWTWQLDKENVVIWGFSELGKKFCDEMMSHGFRPLCFCDNAEKKNGSIYKDISVHNKTWVMNAIKDRDLVVVLCSYYHNVSIAEDLISDGMNEKYLYVVPDYIRLLYEKDLIVQKKAKKDYLNFEVDIAKHCNLKCASCLHFSPLANEGYTDIEIFNNDFVRMSELFKNITKRIYLLGGEPLLNTKINTYITIARNNFPDSRIEIVTNGLLLKSEPKEFWDAVRENSIIINITKYPINVDYNALQLLCTNNGVEYDFYGNETINKHMSHYPLDLSGSQKIDNSFYHCSLASDCITLKNGRLYPCVIPPNIDNFNNYYKLNLDVTERDGIDIYKANDAETILDFLSKPIPFCKYCNVNERTFDNEWSYSKFNIKEWT